MNKGDVILTEKVRKRVFVMDQLAAGQITNAQAAKMLGLSVRQIKRIKKEMQSNGVQALGHGNAGRKPKHALDPSIGVRERVIGATGPLQPCLPHNSHLAVLVP